MKIALITGINGQDGSYLPELLLEKGYIVWGIVRRASEINTQRIEHLYHNKNLIIKYGDMTDSSNLLHIMYEIKENSELLFVISNKFFLLCLLGDFCTCFICDCSNRVQSIYLDIIYHHCLVFIK
jgi:hypothetical protein